MYAKFFVAIAIFCFFAVGPQAAENLFVIDKIVHKDDGRNFAKSSAYWSIAKIRGGSCLSKAGLQLRQTGAKNSLSVASSILAALPECVDCGQPCVFHGTPCCPGKEDDDCWGVCERPPDSNVSFCQ
jgi:hypothetical protein